MPDRIRVQVDQGQWEILGVDRTPGSYPTDVSPSYNNHGPDGLTFNISRDKNVQQTDLDAFTPVEWIPETSGEAAWSGYIVDGPAGEDGLAVQCRGWQHYLDEDVFTANYAFTDLTAWKDARAFPGVDLSKYTSTFQIDVGDGAVRFAYPGPAPAAGGYRRAGIILDLGVNGAAKGGYMEFANDTLTLWAGDSKIWASTADTIGGSTGVLSDTSSGGWVQLADLATGLTGGTSFTFTGTGRYVLIMAETNTVQDAAKTIRLPVIRIYSTVGYWSGSSPLLKASDVVKSIPAKYPALDATQALVDATTLNLGHFHVLAESGRTVLDRVNSYHAWRWLVDERRRVRFTAQPTRATLGVNLDRPGADWKDATATSGLDLYNKVVVVGRTGAGEELLVTRTATNALNRRGRVRSFRLEVAAPTDAAAMAVLGDAFLALHATTPLKGTLTISADDAVRRIVDDAPIAVAELGRYVTELVMLTNLIDPNSGALGRNAVIAAVSVNPDAGVATITVDNTRDNFAALLSRMGAV